MTNDAELIALSAHYCHRFDDGEIDALLALFEADATVEFDGETATGRSDFMVARADGKPPVIGRYDDTYRNSGDRRRFTTRVITVLA
jgi:hypothetical protein